MVICNLASRYSVGQKEATWKTWSKRLKPDPDFYWVISRNYLLNYSVSKEKKCPDFLRAGRPARVVGSQTEPVTSSRRSVFPTQHTPGFWDRWDTGTQVAPWRIPALVSVSQQIMSQFAPVWPVKRIIQTERAFITHRNSVLYWKVKAQQGTNETMSEDLCSFNEQKHPNAIFKAGRLTYSL